MPRRTMFDAGPYTEWLGLSTGLIYGGEINVNPTNQDSIDLEDLVGYVFDYTTSERNPKVTRVYVPAQTIPLENTVNAITWWMVDADGNVVQQSTRPTNSQRRTHIQLGATAQSGGVIFADQSLPVLARETTNQLYDLMYAMGAFNIEGNFLTAAGANMQLNHTAGKVFQVSFNHFAGSVHTNDPHVNTTQAQTPAQFRYSIRTPSPAGPLVNVVDPLNYDLNGVLTPVGGGSNATTIQHVYLFAANNASEQLVIQYGQTQYATFDDALLSIGQEPFIKNPNLSGSVYLYSIVVTRTCTSLQDSVNARLVKMQPLAEG